MKKIAVMNTNPKIYIAISLLDNDWALKIHGQTLTRLAERGGMSHEEIVANVQRLPAHAIAPMDKYYALHIIEILAIKSINLNK